MTVVATSTGHRHASRRPIRLITIATGLVVLSSLGVVFGLRLDQGARAVESPLLGKPAPDFDLPTLDGDRVRLANLLGRPVVINFWASWCVPCREEAPRLESFQARYGADRVTVVGIVWNDARASAKAFRAEFGLSFPQAIDSDGRAALDYGVRGVPETYVVDADGIIQAKVIGAVGPGTLDDLLADALAGRTRTERNDEDYRTRPPT